MRRLPFLTKSDRRALLILEWILILGIFALWMYSNHESTPKGNLSADSLSRSSSFYKRNGRAEKTSTYYVPESIETFPFDPNTADSTQLLKLGLAPWQVRAIYKYRSKHGRYHTPEDFKRLPGMTMELWDRLSPYIRIGDEFRYLTESDLPPKRQYNRPSSSESSELASAGKKGQNSNLSSISSTSVSSDSTGHESLKRDSSSAPTTSLRDGVSIREEKKTSSSYGARGNGKYPVKYPQGTVVDANKADTTELMKIPQIGSYRAGKIVAYREALGGFSRVEQVMESCDMPDEVFEWFSVSEIPLRRLNVNKLTLRQLMRHPYISFYQARAIAEYRKKHGDLKNVDQLEFLEEFTEEDIARLSPYLEF